MIGGSALGRMTERIRLESRAPQAREVGSQQGRLLGDEEVVVGPREGGRSPAPGALDQLHPEPVQALEVHHGRSLAVEEHVEGVRQPLLAARADPGDRVGLPLLPALGQGGQAVEAARREDLDGDPLRGEGGGQGLGVELDPVVRVRREAVDDEGDAHRRGV